MEMGVSQADAARRLNVSRSVVQQLEDQYQSEDSVSKRHVSGRPRVATPAEDRFLALSARRRRSTTVLQLIADHFVTSGRRIFATTVRRRLHNARRPVVCVPLNGRQRRGHLCFGKRTRFLDQTAIDFCTLHRRVQIHTGERFMASADLEGTTYQIPSIQHS
ncbi:hypothetical protein AVEN_208522-1 [Araneus ventricosus]|uniref:Transposase Tc1-like domain-containing protein n=1 Tax=Araneus ventricosus TaxID=182803 RepID=A0A4Y2E3Y7_ARAVE|nr:hypothetical protein AVEN_208522-1 [Araneus ventricosus]